MANIERVYAVPQKGRWRMDIDMRDSKSERDEMIEWCRDNCRGTVFWNETQFAEKGHKMYSFRKRHFDDGYYVVSFWFTHAVSAAKFRLFWEPWNI